jgi:hypothetical protein
VRLIIKLSLEICVQSVQKLHAKVCLVIGGTKTKIYFQATISQTCAPAVLYAIRVGMTKVENQAKPLKYSEEKLYFYQFSALSKLNCPQS